MKWQLVNPKAPFAPRDGAGILSYKGRMWLLGGWNPNDKINFPKICNSEVWSSEDGVKWYPETGKAEWQGRHYAGYAVHREKMWIIGGDCNQGHYQPDIWNSEDGINWTRIRNNVEWGQRAFHHTVVFKDKIWIMGGQTLPQFVNSTSKTIIYNDVWCSEDGENWEQKLPEAPWSPRGFIGGSVVFNDRMWILGGGTYDTPDKPMPRKFYNDVWSSRDGINWDMHAENTLWCARSMHETAVFDNKMWVLEGTCNVSEPTYSTKNLNDAWYSPDGVNWTKMQDIPWSARHAASVVVHDGALWMIAGNNMESDVWKLCD